ncbi:hypothetical protein PoB_005028500 [Plakobranchus ocellatus]|uniref:Uncharacterized protein n=1 Tax=Plakobranchus ocellatus TaxID=259542 RepID=A0AAV4BWR6_9GAST|nr:hypothetical protein PoB_005028500 [Plakobranchus ocellatus]
MVSAEVGEFTDCAPGWTSSRLLQTQTLDYDKVKMVLMMMKGYDFTEDAYRFRHIARGRPSSNPSTKEAGAGVIAKAPRKGVKKDPTANAGPALDVTDNLQRKINKGWNVSERKSCTRCDVLRRAERSKGDEGSPCAYPERGDRRSRSRLDAGQRM